MLFVGSVQRTLGVALHVVAARIDRRFEGVLLLLEPAERRSKARRSRRGDSRVGTTAAGTRHFAHHGAARRGRVQVAVAESEDGESPATSVFPVPCSNYRRRRWRREEDVQADP